MVVDGGGGGGGKNTVATINDRDDVGVEDDCQSVARIYGIKSEPLNKYT